MLLIWQVHDAARAPAMALTGEFARSAPPSLRKRMSEKWPSGGMARRSIRRMPRALPPTWHSVRTRTRCASRACAPPAQTMLERAPRTGFGTDAADQDDLAARLQNPRELIERRLRIRRGGHDILRDHDVERVVGKGEALGVHDPEALDVAEPELGRRAPAPCAASVRRYRCRKAGSPLNSAAARCRFRRRLPECDRRRARRLRSQHRARARTPRRIPSRKPEPTGRRPW